MCGRTLLSIFLKSRGRREYFWINSLLRNSPLTSVTFPFSSNSVHRSLSSLLGFIMRPPRPALSSRKPDRAGSSFEGELLEAFRGCRSLRQNGSRFGEVVLKAHIRAGILSWFVNGRGASCGGQHGREGAIMFLVLHDFVEANRWGAFSPHGEAWVCN